MSNSKLIGESLIPSLQGVIPAVIATSSANGSPNVTYISQVFYVDERHVALSQQFFNKTIRNIRENPVACVVVTCPITFKGHKLLLKFKESRTDGEVFDSMQMQLEAIAGAQGMVGTFQLKAADIYEVLSIEDVYNTPQ
jgi:predicted pyridoxine 5'-phosphate oxidase superfamily flavin-nucleotide-binding protein